MSTQKEYEEEWFGVSPHARTWAGSGLNLSGLGYGKRGETCRRDCPRVSIDARETEIDEPFLTVLEKAAGLAQNYKVQIDLNCSGARFGARPHGAGINAWHRSPITPWPGEPVDSYWPSFNPHPPPYASDRSETWHADVDRISHSCCSDRTHVSSSRIGDVAEALGILIVAFLLVGVLGSFATDRHLLSELGLSIWNAIC